MSAERRRMILGLMLALVVLGGLAGAFHLFAPDQAPDAAAEEAFWVTALAETGEGFAPPPADWRLRLPEDHGPHPATATESWALAAHLTTAEGEEMGVQFSLLRLGITPPGAAQEGDRSIWAIDTLYRAHVILAGPGDARAVGEERFGRGIPGLAGFDSEARAMRLDNWVLGFGEGEGEIQLTATVGDTARLQLALTPERPALSSDGQQDAAPVAGYGITRLAARGTFDDGSGPLALSGTAWFDHLWGALPLPGAGPISWDRLQLQLGDGTDVSLARSRRRDGRGEPIVDGFVAGSDGQVSTPGEGEIRLSPSRTWQQPDTGTEYPIAWQVQGAGLDLTVEPVTLAQAFDFAVPMWSGLVRVSGTRDGSPVTGQGTMQLTGYAAE